MIGVYNYTVILTYFSLISSVFGITQAATGHIKIALCCLALSGLLDMFDGKVARTKKDRSEDERSFGIQIDSLCDVICFGVLPSVICYFLSMRGIFTIIIICYYCVCSVIRLSFFNVLETSRQQVEMPNTTNKYYHGLPITSIAVILPLAFLLNLIVPAGYFSLIIVGVLLITGTLFIIDFKFHKPSNKELIIIVSVVAVAVIITIVFSRFKIFNKLPIIRIPFLNK